MGNSVYSNLDSAVAGRAEINNIHSEGLTEEPQLVAHAMSIYVCHAKSNISTYQQSPGPGLVYTTAQQKHHDDNIINVAALG